MIKRSDIIIIGGGAAGLMAAAGAASVSASGVTVLEKMSRPGRKIMITGKGRCNFTNMKGWNDFSRHLYPKPNFLRPAFYNMPSEKMVSYMEENGLKCIVERGDRAFPSSYQSCDVVDTLVKAAENAGAEICCSKEVCHIENTSSDAGNDFRIKCSDGSEFTCRKLIICTGGLSYPATGSTGDGYRWAAGTGHRIARTFPSLTALVPKGYKIEDQKGHIHRNTPLSESGKLLYGNKLKNIGLSVIIDGNQVQNEFGDLEFTDGGLEGPVGFKVSRKCVNALINGSKVILSLDLKPAVETDALKKRIATLWDEISSERPGAGKNYASRFSILLGRLMPSSLKDAFLKYRPGSDHKTLASDLKDWRFEIAGYVGYERCVITAGGVSLEDISHKTMESRHVKGLYFAGEVLDIDADTGGYNLQCAFSTGYLAGISAARGLSE